MASELEFELESWSEEAKSESESEREAEIGPQQEQQTGRTLFLFGARKELRCAID